MFKKSQQARRKASSQKPASSGNNDNSKLIAAKLEEGDIKGAVRLAASDDTFLPPTFENKTLLDAKHPPAPADKLHPHLTTVFNFKLASLKSGEWSCLLTQVVLVDRRASDHNT